MVELMVVSLAVTSIVLALIIVLFILYLVDRKGSDNNKNENEIESDEEEVKEKVIEHDPDAPLSMSLSRLGPKLPFKFNAVSFADGERYTLAILEPMLHNMHCFDEILALGPNDLEAKFLQRWDPFMKKHNRGYGYWIWKPQVVRQGLQSIGHGDFLFSMDGGQCLRQNARESLLSACLTLLCSKYDVMLFSSLLPEKEWNKRSIYNIVRKYTHPEEDPPAPPETWAFTPNEDQSMGGFALIRKTPATVKFIDMWLHLATMDNGRNLIDDEDTSKEYPCFKEHRHDQSLLSLLGKSLDVVLQTKFPLMIRTQNGKIL